MKNTDHEAALHAFLLPPATSRTVSPQIRLTTSPPAPSACVLLLAVHDAHIL